MSRPTAVNVGTIGHIDHGRSTLSCALLAIAAAGVLQSAPKAIMPTRLPDPACEVVPLPERDKSGQKSAWKSHLLDIRKRAFGGGK